MSTTPPVTIGSFREDFPVFANTATWPDDQIQFWINIATSMLNQCRWGDQWKIAIDLYVAHNIVLEAYSAGGGDLPGLARGVVSGESGAATSVSYDVPSATVAGASHWNLTIYGIRLARLISFFGAGPIQFTGSFYGEGYGGGGLFVLNGIVGIGPGWRNG